MLNPKHDYKRFMRINKKAALTVTSLCLIFFALGALFVYAQTSTTFTISAGPYPGAADYTVYAEGGLYYAKDRYGAQLVAAGSTNASYVVTLAVAAASNGAEIHFSSAITLTATVDVTKVVHFTGSDSQYTSLTFSAGVNGFRIANLHGVAFSYLAISSAGNTKADQGIIYVNASYGTLEHVWLTGWHYALYLDSATSMTINDLHTNLNLISLTEINNCVNNKVSNSFLTGHGNAAGSRAVFADANGGASEGLEFDQTIFFGAETAVELTDTGYSLFTGCKFDTYSSYGLYVSNCSYGQVINSFFGSANAGTVGFKLGANSLLWQIGNNYFSNKQYNLEINNGYYDTITGNVFQGTATSHIANDNSLQYSTITGNAFHYMGGSYAIFTNNGEYTNGTIITGNSIESPLQVAVSNTPGRARVCGNTGFITETVGQVTVTNGASYPHGLSGTPTSVTVSLAGAAAGDTYPIVAVSAVTATEFFVRVRYQNGTGMDPVSIFYSAVYVP